MRLHRSALFAGLLAFGVAACGDDVQVVDPPDAPPPPLNVSVSPQNQQIMVGQTADFAVNISGGVEGAAISWTCSAANPNVASGATETATGCRVTGANAGSTTVNVTVTKGSQTAQAGGQVTVSAIPSEPATVSISSLNQGGNPAIITAIRGQLNVTMNVVRNDETPTKLTLWLGGTEVASQTWAPQAADEADLVELPDGQIVQQITLSFLTDRYNGMFPGDPVTGEAWHLNGLHMIQATLEVAERPGDPIASNSFDLNLANFNRLHVSDVGTEDHHTKLPTNSAFDNAGNIWYGGPNSGNVEFRAVPVIYQPQTTDPTLPRQVASLTMNFGACGSQGPVTNAPFDYSYSCAGVESTGLAPTISGTVQGVDGNPITFGGFAAVPFPNLVPAIVGPHPFPIRVDKQAPSGAAIAIVSSNGNRENWVNAAYPVAAGYNTASDGGVGLPVGAPSNGQERRFEVRTGTSVTFTSDWGASPLMGDVGIGNSPNNSQYNLRVQARDRLGNTTSFLSQSTSSACGTVGSLCHLTASNATSHNRTTFGYDEDAPVASRGQVAGEDLLPNQLQHVFNTLPGAEVYQVQAQDVISGFAAPTVPLSSAALRHSHIRVLATPNSPNGALVPPPSGSAGITNLIGTTTNTATPFAVSESGSGFVNSPAWYNDYTQTPTTISTLGGTSIPVDAAGPQYEIYQAQARDKAGNLSDIIAWQVYHNDNEAPIFTGLVAQVAYFGGQPATFPGTADDAVEVYQGSFSLHYPGIGDLVYERASPQVQELFDDSIMSPAFVDYTADAFIRSLDIVDGSHAPVSGTLVKPNLITARVFNGTLEGMPTATYPCDLPGGAYVRPCHLSGSWPAADPAEGASGHGFAAILPNSVENGESFGDVAAPTAINEWSVTGYTVSAASGPIPTRTATLQIRARGVTNTFLNPFADDQAIVVVELIVDDAGDRYLRPINGTLTPQFNDPFPTLDNGIIRDYDWNFTFTLPALAGGEGVYTNGARCIHAVGLSEDFDGLATLETNIPFDATQAAMIAPGYDCDP
jgi:hypothetical protein